MRPPKSLSLTLLGTGADAPLPVTTVHGCRLRMTCLTVGVTSRPANQRFGSQSLLDTSAPPAAATALAAPWSISTLETWFEARAGIRPMETDLESR